MKKPLIITIAIVVVLALCAILGYNSLVSAQAGVEEQKANIMAQLQRRADLIPNIVKTVNNYTTHETEVFAAVNASREKLLSAQTITDLANSNEEMSAALTQLVAIAEAYPELKSDTVYVGLMDELAGTENRIAVARKDFNAAVKDYNLSIRSFPGVLFAGLFGFAEEEYFIATDEAQAIVPEVS